MIDQGKLGLANFVPVHSAMTDGHCHHRGEHRQRFRPRWKAPILRQSTECGFS
jgi:hypothetical protein